MDFMLEFQGDAIVLSGLHGTGLKSKFLGMYYDYWWPITSGGMTNQNLYPTAIVDFYAGSGEVYLKDTKETVLGSAGHALNLKFNSKHNTDYLRVIAIESNAKCYEHLIKVTSRRWPQSEIRSSFDFTKYSKNTIWLINSDVGPAIDTLKEKLTINSIFLFDPLLFEGFDIISRLASSRLTTLFRTGTEFIIFMFTSDWFEGRDFSEEDRLVALPKSLNVEEWTDDERITVSYIDRMMGDSDWWRSVIRDRPQEARMANLVNEYSIRLHSWFRYVLPLPFAPKKTQRYHLFCCTNHHAGFSGTRGFYCDVSKNLKYEPDNKLTTTKFRELHPALFRDLHGNRKPLEWKILWQFIKSSGFGTCDARAYEGDSRLSISQNKIAVEWLIKTGYLIPYSGKTAFDDELPRFQLNWPLIESTLDISMEPLFTPPSTVVQTTLDKDLGVQKKLFTDDELGS